MVTMLVLVLVKQGGLLLQIIESCHHFFSQCLEKAPTMVLGCLLSILKLPIDDDLCKQFHVDLPLQQSGKCHDIKYC